MKWPFSFRGFHARKRVPTPGPSLTSCPACGREMDLVERTTFTGNDMRTYRCQSCRAEHIVDFGPALWKILSEANDPDGER